MLTAHQKQELIDLVDTGSILAIMAGLLIFFCGVAVLLINFMFWWIAAYVAFAFLMFCVFSYFRDLELPWLGQFGIVDAKPFDTVNRVIFYSVFWLVTFIAVFLTALLASLVYSSMYVYSILRSTLNNLYNRIGNLRKVKSVKGDIKC